MTWGMGSKGFSGILVILHSTIFMVFDLLGMPPVTHSSDRRTFPLPFSTTYSNDFDVVAFGNDASDVGWVKFELGKLASLEVASLFNVLLGKGQGARVDRCFRNLCGFDGLLVVDISVDVDFASFGMLFDALADIFKSLLLRVGGRDSFCQGFVKALEHFVLGLNL